MAGKTFVAGLLLLLCSTPSLWAEEDRQLEKESEPSGCLNIQANAEFIDVETTSRITQRFEMYDPHSRQALVDLKEMGFTQVILDWPTLHVDAAEVGLNVVLANWWIGTTPPAEIEAALKLATEVDPQRLVGISMMDEPNRNSKETPFVYYIDQYRKLRARLDHSRPAVRLEISHWGPLGNWDRHRYDYFSDLYEAADVMRIMPYPDLHERHLSDVYFMMQRSRKLMRAVNRSLPLLVILQTWVLPPKSELPTIEELRVMAYQAMLGGAETLSFFEYNLEVWDKTPGFHDDFRELMRELTALSNRFADSSITSSIDSHGILTGTLTDPTGETNTIRVNTNRIAMQRLKPLEVIVSPVVQ